ncbi:unnamed protein product [Sphagnum troendelagicum]|uniref:J domain-containing protein n=1 Tax=Sphagnum troendelagicum TaxID=128251 RepID=A0ABP0TTL1_9BRYO
MLLLDKEEDLGMMGIFLVCRTIGMASSMMILQARRRFGWWQFVRASSSSSWKDDGGGGENAYTILGLQRSCSVESIRAAFRELAKATHPDLQPNCADDDDSRRSSAQQFVRVLAAYQILADPQMRAAYDAELQAEANHKESKGTIREQQQQSDSTTGGRGDLEVAEWLKKYQRSAVLESVVHPQGLGFQELHLRGELRSALLKAFHGPQLIEGWKGRIPDCFEADERAGLGTDEILHLVSGRQLFGFVRQQQQQQQHHHQQPPLLLQDLHCVNPPPLDSDDDQQLPSHPPPSDSARRTFFNLTNSGPTDKNSRRRRSPSYQEELLHSTDASAYVDLELHLFGKLVAKATRSRSNASNNGYTDGIRSHDFVSVFLTAEVLAAAATAPGDSEPAQNWISDPQTVYATPSVNPKFLGTIHGLGATKLGRVCAVYGPDGRRTHKIVQHQTPLVKHMWWFKEGGRCECRCRRASLPSSRFWIFAPRSTTHDVGGWYIETWEKEDHVPRSKTLGLREHNEQRLHPAMFIMAVAYKTLDSETGRTYEKSLVSKIAKVKDTLSTFLKWWKTS